MYDQYVMKLGTMSKEEKKIPWNQLIYFPIGPRLQRLYATKNIAENMRWAEVIVHPSDSEAWKPKDALYPNFACGPRNVRLGLCTDGFSPFGDLWTNLLIQASNYYIL